MSFFNGVFDGIFNGVFNGVFDGTFTYRGRVVEGWML